MNRAVDVARHPQLAFRELFTGMTHPLLDQKVPSETSPAPFTRIPRAELRPAPMPGEHTYEICGKILGLTPGQIDGLIADGALFAYEKKN
jgi:crotonobetainyl-CoA:carnitine CoA-transferase CaiB-like acyl-CoA transferase